MSDVLLEITVPAADAEEAGIESRDEIERPLEEALLTSGLGEVTGGGGGMGVYIIEVEVDEERFDAGLDLIRTALQLLRVPRSTRITRNHPDKVAFLVYE